MIYSSLREDRPETPAQRYNREQREKRSLEKAAYFKKRGEDAEARRQAEVKAEKPVAGDERDQLLVALAQLLFVLALNPPQARRALCAAVPPPPPPLVTRQRAAHTGRLFNLIRRTP